MRITRYTDPHAYRQVAVESMEKDPVLHALHASVVAAVSGDQPGYEAWTFYVGERSDGSLFLAHHTPPFPIHMPLGDAQAAAELAEDVFRAGEQPKAVGGHLTSVRAFAERWEELTGQGARVAMTLGVYDLPGPATPPWAVSGEARVATASDLELVRQWKLAFHAETDSGHGRPPHIDDSAVPNGEVLLWCDPEPVAMAEAAHADTVPIRWVYTPPEHRGHGYGSAVTAAISTARQAEGATVMLYTDLENPTSNGIYQALGFRFLGDSAELAFVDAES